MAFYRWLTGRYPLLVIPAIDREDSSENGGEVDLTSPNPNGYEFDNLYLDMNGIIHDCFHPRHKPAPKTYRDAYQCIFECIDRIMAIVRPRKLLYLSIDGVAPRAKMNHQRSRRFKHAKEKIQGSSAEPRATEEATVTSEEQPKPKTQSFDSNVITPGTEFMAELSAALHCFIQLRLSQNTGWQKMKVILSDSSVPGEGVHKIMSFIRLQRNRPGYDPNTRHCLYGLDANLIMLALATHEVHFTILREDVSSKGEPRQGSSFAGEEPSSSSEKEEPSTSSEKTVMDELPEVNYELMRIWMLREFLDNEFRMAKTPFRPDFERLVDDFVLMCFLIGNDFLPSLPSLDIRSGAVTTLFQAYKACFCAMNGYLTGANTVNLKTFEIFMKTLGETEEGITQKGNADKKSFMGSSLAGPSSDSRVTRWKNGYYADRFGSESETVRQLMADKYTEGLFWVFQYYYRGVSDWTWFYPYHYAPFASDFKETKKLDIKFSLGSPLKPFEQLMAVLPPASADALPPQYKQLMVDPASPLKQLFPEDFELDMKGKAYASQGVALLPFIDIDPLCQETTKLEATLTPVESTRNSFGVDLLFVSCQHPLGAYVHSCMQNPKQTTYEIKQDVSEGMNGVFSMCKNTQTRVASNVVYVEFAPPPYQDHQPRLLEGVRMPPQEKITSSRNSRFASSRQSTLSNASRRFTQQEQRPGSGSRQSRSKSESSGSRG